MLVQLVALPLWASACQLDDRQLEVASARAEPEASAAPPASPASMNVNEDGLRPAGNVVESRTGDEIAIMPSDLVSPVPLAGTPEPLPLALGQACSAGSAACEAPLRCVDGTCRLPCVTGADCAELGSAVECRVGAALDGSGVGACSYSSYCDPAHPQSPVTGASNCAAGSGCRPSQTGESVCLAQPGGGLSGTACASDVDCGVAHFCGEAGTCRRYCLSDADCGAEVCSPFASARRAGNVAVGFCASPYCDPVHPQAPRDDLSACPAGFGCSSVGAGELNACEPRAVIASERYGACLSNADCRPGLLCGTADIAGACNQYCFSDADCPGERCRAFTDPRFAGPHPLGICAAVCNPANPASPAGGFGVCPSGFGCAATPEGLSLCLVEGTRLRYEPCAGQECVAGHACGLPPFGYCSRYCLSDADCGGGRCRLGAGRAGDASVGTCAEVCNPADPLSAQPPFSPCPPGFGCTEDDEGLSQCVQAGSGGVGAACEDRMDCGAELFCEQQLGQCREYCLSDADCSLGSCSGVFERAFAADREVRACVL